MKTMNPKAMKWLKFFHVIFAITWIGSAMGLLLIPSVVIPDGENQMYTMAYIVWLLDQLLIWVGVMGILITAIIYGVWTKWGFFKHKWLTLKWVTTIVMILLGTFVMGPAVDGNVCDLKWYDQNSMQFYDNLRITIIWGSVQFTMLLFVVYLSVFKPFKAKNKEIKKSA